MELARLASSSKQQASKLAPQGPFRAPEQQGSQNRKKMLPRHPGWFSATFSDTNFFSVRPPPVGKGDFVVFWPILGRRHSENFRNWAKNSKTQFPGARGLETENKSYHAIRDGCPQRSCILHFDRPDPHGRENAKYEDFRPFWPRTAVGTWRNPGPRPKTENRNFPVLRGPR